MCTESAFKTIMEINVGKGALRGICSVALSDLPGLRLVAQMPLHWVIVRLFMQCHSGYQWIQHILIQYMVAGLFSSTLWFLLCLVFFFLFFGGVVGWGGGYFVYTCGSSLMYFNVCCIIWEKRNIKNNVNLLVNMLLSIAFCQGKSIQDILIDSLVQARASHLWISPNMNSIHIYPFTFTSSLNLFATLYISVCTDDR